MWDRLAAAFKHSVTILWARLVALSGLALIAAQNLTADPTIGDAIKSLLKPEYLPWYVIGIGIITELCRRRTAGKDG